MHAGARLGLLPAGPAEALANLGHGLQALVIGLPGTMTVFGVREHSVPPTWSLPLIALGLWQGRERRLSLAWLALALWPLLLNSSANEPNRIILATPIFCLLAGLGAEALLKRAPLVLVLVLGLGVAHEAAAYAVNIRGVWAVEYAESEAMQGLSQGVQLRADFNYKLGAGWRFIAGQREGKPERFALPWELAPGLKGVSLRQAPVSAALPPYLVIDAAPQAIALRLWAVDHGLNAIRLLYPERDRRARRDGLLRQLKQDLDPLLWSILLEQALLDSGFVGDLPPELVKAVFSPKLISASAPLWLADQALKAGDRPGAHMLCLRARAIDPRCGCSL